MRTPEQFRSDLRNVVLNLIAQGIWVVLAAASVGVTVYVLQFANLTELIRARISVPAWIILLGALAGFLLAVFLIVSTRRASAVRGRLNATDANVRLLASRKSMKVSDRRIRSTRCGRWPAGEELRGRTRFREELEQAIRHEGADVRRIWNISSMDDVTRLREILSRYQGAANHSIRLFFGVPDFVLPEVLVVDGMGGSLSFPSTRTPHTLDWMIRFRRRDLVRVVRDYFDVLWDRADRILDAGEIVPGGLLLLAAFEQQLAGPPDDS